ncbi:MAG: hypothetical protein CMJ64_12015 [Planctomycetaceae bacterium]|nr:hypothetical protein [Planctomycetaceae bacterium]
MRFLQRTCCFYTCLCLLGLCLLGTSTLAEEATLHGSIIDVETGTALPARLYIEATDGKLYHARSASPDGSAVEYNNQRSPTSVEVHTTLSAHPFAAKLPRGKYKVTAERGKEYFSAATDVDLTNGDAEVTLKLRRWIDTSKRHWYSGETHVHRSMDELPNAMLADDLNVALPLTHWVTQAYLPPTQGDKNSPEVAAKLIEIDPTHVIYPLNTEYEIFAVDGKRHTLGAIFALNHKTVFTKGVPPVTPIAEQAHREGALLELDKHNWPWSMMLVPIMDVDLYELTNNHVWRTEFFFKGFGEPPASFMNVARDRNGMTERGWLRFTFQNYYTLLNCGFRLRPTAGTASGVHPVPLGFGRVYVHLPDGFSYDAWMDGLDAGHSFVTTGPMLDVFVNTQRGGATLKYNNGQTAELKIWGWTESEYPLPRIEVVSMGSSVALDVTNTKTARGLFRNKIDTTAEFAQSGWIAVRCFEQLPNGRFRFAHSSPVYIDIAGKPYRPRKQHVNYLIERVKKELERHAGVLPEAALEEYRKALSIYEKIAETAR